MRWLHYKLERFCVRNVGYVHQGEKTSIFFPLASRLEFFLRNKLRK